MALLENAYAILIGVDNDQETPQPIRDAQGMYNVLSNENLCGYKKENMTLLVDEEATTKNIMGSINSYIEKVDVNSTFLLYYSGHGGYEEDKKNGRSYLLPFDATAENLIFGKDLRSKLSQMKSKRIFVIFDCCYAGSFFEKGKDDVITESIAEKTKDLVLQRSTTLKGMAQEIDNEQGMVIMASSQSHERSWGDFEQDDYSIFTTSLIEALKAENNKHKEYFSDEFIRTVDTVNYVFERTPQLFKELKKRDVNNYMTERTQKPYANLQMSADFPICYIPKEFRSRIATNKFKPIKVQTSGITAKSDTSKKWERKEGNNLLLFVHGFSGESGDTFGTIPEMLQSDSNFDGWAMLPLGYSPIVQPKLGKDIWGGILDVDKIAGFLSTSISFNFKHYDRIAIVAHSLGGLVAQRAILDLDETDRNRISHLIMFGTPSNGISPEILSQQWNKKYSEMSSEGEFITSLRSEWKQTFKDNFPFKLKVAASTDDEFVSLESCHKPFNKGHREFVTKKHLDMVKPESDDDATYSLILDTLTGSKFFEKYNNRKEINLILGKYDAVVRELLPLKDELDKVGLTQLIFALEGLDTEEYREEIYNILNNNPTAKNNTDLMGILGGRHKRDYLKKPIATSSILAKKYYSQALEISVEREIHSQIYYHAINLAFLSIVTDPETGSYEMKQYANQALEATKHCDDNFWKYATVAEANLYLKNFDVSKEFYIKASADVPIREKLSMYTNAYRGYVALTKKEDDEFTQFLKAQLLT